MRVARHHRAIAALAFATSTSVAFADVRVTEIAADVVMVTGRVANMAVLRTSAGLVIVDTLISPLHAREARGALAQRFPGAPIRYVINSHYHLDHHWGNQSYPEAIVLAHRRTCERMSSTLVGAAELLRGAEELTKIRERLAAAPSVEEEGAKLAAELARWETRHARYAGFRLREPDLCLAGDTTLRVGGKTIELLHLGAGHTDGDLVVRFVEDEVVVTGDLVFSGAFPVIDLDGGVDLTNWVTALEALARGAGKRSFVPGHGAPGGVEIVRAQAEYLSALWSGVRAAQAAGLELALAEASIELPEHPARVPLLDDRAANIAAAWRLAENAPQ